MARQRTIDRIYEYIVNYALENQYVPTMQEIADAIGHSKSTIWAVFNVLEEQGKIERHIEKGNRAYKITELEMKRR